MAGGWRYGRLEEGDWVVTPAAALRLDHPSEQRTLSGGPVLRQQDARLRRGWFTYGLNRTLQGLAAVWLVGRVKCSHRT